MIPCLAQLTRPRPQQTTTSGASRPPDRRLPRAHRSPHTEMINGDRHRMRRWIKAQTPRATYLGELRAIERDVLQESGSSEQSSTAESRSFEKRSSAQCRIVESSDGEKICIVESGKAAQLINHLLESLSSVTRAAGPALGGRPGHMAPDQWEQSGAAAVCIPAEGPADPARGDRVPGGGAVLSCWLQRRSCGLGHRRTRRSWCRGRAEPAG